MKLALNPFKGKKPGKKAEQEQKIEFELDEKVERVLEQYMQIPFSHYYSIEDHGINTKINSLDYETLRPAQIDTLLQKIIQTAPEEQIKNYLTGRFLSKLIQKSYKAGNNNFTLTTKQTEIGSLGSHLAGFMQDIIQVTIQGNAGQGLGYDSALVTYNIQGNVGYSCGSKSAYCEYNIEGNAGTCLGLKSGASTYNLQGTVGDKCGDTAYNCFFTTSNIETYKKMVADVKEYELKDNEVEYTGQ